MKKSISTFLKHPIKDKVNVDYVTVRKGGDGAFREFADLIIKER